MLPTSTDPRYADHHGRLAPIQHLHHCDEVEEEGNVESDKLQFY